MTKTPVPRPRASRSDGEATRARILAVAGERFAASGFADTTNKDIAADAEVDGVLELLDFKTCKALYDEHWFQVLGGYSILLQENGYPFERVRIVRVGRDESEGFEEAVRARSSLAEEVFIYARGLYSRVNQFRKEGK